MPKSNRFPISKSSMYVPLPSFANKADSFQHKIPTPGFNHNVDECLKQKHSVALNRTGHANAMICDHYTYMKDEKHLMHLWNRTYPKNLGTASLLGHSNLSTEVFTASYS